MRCLKTAILATFSISASALRSPERSQPAEQGVVSEVTDEEKTREISPWEMKPTMEERKEKARREEVHNRIEERRRRKEEKQRRREERVALRRPEYIPPANYTPQEKFVEPDLHPTKFFAKKYPPGKIIHDMRTGTVIGGIVGLMFKNHLRTHFMAVDKIALGIADAIIGAMYGTVIGFEVGLKRDKRLGFNMTRGDHEQRVVAKHVFRGVMWGLIGGWLLGEMLQFRRVTKGDFNDFLEDDMSKTPLAPIRAATPGMPWYSNRARCNVKEDATVANGWDLGAYVKFPWYPQWMMESWYQPLESFPCTEARYIAKEGFEPPKWGESNTKYWTEGKGKGHMQIDVRNIAPIRPRSEGQRVMEQTLLKKFVESQSAADTFGFLCARRVTRKHGLYVAPCFPPVKDENNLDVTPEKEDSTEPAPKPVNYWVLAYSEKEYGGYAVVVAGQPDMTAPDGTCNFVQNYMKGMWLMTRRRTVDPAVVETLLTKMHDELNLDTSEMKPVPQDRCDMYYDA